MECTILLLTPSYLSFFFQDIAADSEKTLHMVIQLQKEARGEVSCIATELLEEQKTKGPCLHPFMQGIMKIAWIAKAQENKEGEERKQEQDVNPFVSP